MQLFKTARYYHRGKRRLHTKPSWNQRVVDERREGGGVNRALSHCFLWPCKSGSVLRTVPLWCLKRDCGCQTARLPVTRRRPLLARARSYYLDPSCKLFNVSCHGERTHFGLYRQTLRLLPFFFRFSSSSSFFIFFLFFIFIFYHSAMQRHRSRWTAGLSAYLRCRSKRRRHNKTIKWIVVLLCEGQQEHGALRRPTWKVWKGWLKAVTSNTVILSLTAARHRVHLNTLSALPE